MFGKTLKKLREEFGYSQEELAKKAKLHRTYVSQLERDLKSPSLKTLQKLSAIFNMETSEMVRRIETDNV